MINGLYTAASGMNAEMLRQDVVANNLANAATVGFKKDEAVFRAFPATLLRRIHDKLQPGATPSGLVDPAPVIGVAGRGAQVDSVVTNFSNGSLSRTDGKLDLALQGNALFTVERGDGSTAYTRSGQFSLNAVSQLVTVAGDLVVGKNGQPIVLDGRDVVVDESGRIALDGKVIGDLQLVAYDPATFVKEGEGYYTANEPAIVAFGDTAVPDARVMQGYIEQANISVVEEMVRMISVMRAYEANQKSIQMQDETLGKVINEVGRAG